MTKAPDPKLAEAGRKGGIASGEARRKRARRTLIDVIRARVSSDPEAVAEKLLTTAAGSVVAVRLLEASGDFAPPEAEPTLAPVQHGREVILAELRALGLVVPAATDSTNPLARELRDETCDLERASAWAESEGESRSARGGAGASAEMSRNPAPIENVEPLQPQTAGPSSEIASPGGHPPTKNQIHPRELELAEQVREWRRASGLPKLPDRG